MNVTEEVRVRTAWERITTQTKTQSRHGFGHVLKMKPNSLPKTALITRAPEKKIRKVVQEKNVENSR